MILIHIIYIPFYYLFRPLRHKYFDSDSFAYGLISFFVGFTTTMIYDLTIADNFSKKIRGAVLVTSIVLSFLFFILAYRHKDIPKDIVIKHKNTLILGLIIDFAWAILVVNYLMTRF